MKKPFPFAKKGAGKSDGKDDMPMMKGAKPGMMKGKPPMKKKGK